MYKKLEVVTNVVPVGQVSHKFQNDFQCVTSHVNVKSIQAKDFQDDIDNHQPVLMMIIGKNECSPALIS